MSKPAPRRAFTTADAPAVQVSLPVQTGIRAGIKQKVTENAVGELNPSAPMTHTSLPALPAAWVQALLGQPPPPEREARCEPCVQCAPPGAPARADRAWFRPDAKCCTFHPSLPSYLVGRILAGEASDEGRDRVRRRLTGPAATPLGLRADDAHRALYRQAKDAFGRSLALRCPYFLEDSGGCGVWASREGVCATYFCKHERGAVGAAFWEGLRDLLGAAERDLSLALMLELDPGEEAVQLALRRPTLGAAELDAAETEAARRRRWGRWAGQEEAYYRACAEKAAALSWPEVLARCGPEVAARAALVRAAHARLLSGDVPSPLRVGALQVVELAGGSATVAGYSALDPLSVPIDLLALLERFDGRETAAALADLQAEGVDLEPALVRRLADFGLLVRA